MSELKAFFSTRLYIDQVEGRISSWRKSGTREILYSRMEFKLKAIFARSLESGEAIAFILIYMFWHFSLFSLSGVCLQKQQQRQQLGKIAKQHLKNFFVSLLISPPTRHTAAVR